jgi:UDP-N-acetylmuramate dehydrogenase
MSEFEAQLREIFGADRIRRDARLAELTTFHVGGPAEWLVEARGSDEIVAALTLAHRERVGVTMLGGGSNVLISDHGVRGLVLRPRGGQICRLCETGIKADAAVTMNGLVRWTITQSVAGLERWAGTPGTVGGAIFGNAHFGDRNIGDIVTAAWVASRTGVVQEVRGSEIGFAYDCSRLQKTGEVLLSAVFRVSAGDPAILRARARESLAYRKKTQPLGFPSAGCVFQNPDRARDRLPEGVPWSAGALIDRAGLKGYAVGGASVSVGHANFIVNDGTATARDIRRLVAHCRRTVREKFGVELRDEIVYLGDFDVDTTD